MPSQKSYIRTNQKDKNHYINGQTDQSQVHQNAQPGVFVSGRQRIFVKSKLSSVFRHQIRKTTITNAKQWMLSENAQAGFQVDKPIFNRVSWRSREERSLIQ